MADNELISITATRIRELRKELGWSQADLARRISVGATTVRQWEKGMTMPDVVSLRGLCRVFYVTADYLLGLSESRPICIGYLPTKDQVIVRKMLEVFRKFAIKDSSHNNPESISDSDTL